MNIKIGSFFNIPLYFNLFTLPFMFFAYVQQGWVGFAIYSAGLFFVVLHEYGHCFAAIRKGMTAEEVYILPIGGIARLKYNVENAYDEIYVALAGPAVNLAIIVILMPFLCLAYVINSAAIFIIVLVIVFLNALIFLFNLVIAVFPMDGGRVLRGLLSLKLGHERATWWAVKFGQTLATVLIAVSLIFGYFIPVIIFAYMIYESQKEILRSRISGAVSRIRTKLAADLKDNTFLNISMSDLIDKLKCIKDEEVKSKLKVDELIIVLEEVQLDNS